MLAITFKTVCYGLGGALFVFAASLFVVATARLEPGFLISLGLGVLGGAAGILIATRRRALPA